MKLWEIAAATIILIYVVLIGVAIYAIAHFFLKFW